ncbi:hypothetical protein AGMMS50293_08660 [Spirochaetia bacterium]|nr:hypothetical protein AGMMS50293_08660 [Spirochaetia bacterium]
MTNQELRQKIDETLAPFAPIPWGIARLSEELPLPYEKAFVAIIPFSHMIRLDEYTEPFLRSLQLGAVQRRRQVLKAVRGLFDSLNLEYKNPPHTEAGEVFEKTMTEIYSTKDAARRAGLGWIGKSNLLVTKEFGPRLTMAELLINGPLEPDAPIEKSFCGNCDRCSKNCAFQVIHNRDWVPETRREDQVDYIGCSLSRLAYVPKIGRKLACGKCITVCPWGTAGGAAPV